MIWRPYDIEVILWHHISWERFPRETAPEYGPTIRRLTDMGVLEYADGVPKTSLLGQGLVHLWQQTPLPVVRYVDPRLEKGDDA